jgi:hypothetical protein
MLDFIFQPNRITSIRTDKFKYINDKENKEEYFYDLETDPGETKKNFDISSKDIYHLKKLYYTQESESTLFWLEKIKNFLNKINLNKIINFNDEIYLIFLGQSILIIPFIRYLQKYKKVINLYLIDVNLISNIKSMIDYNGVNLKLLNKIKKKQGIVVIEDVYNSFFINKFKEVNIKNMLIIDSSLNLSNSKFKMILKSKIKFAFGPFNRMFLRREIYRENYFLFIDDLIYIFKRAFHLFFSKFVIKKKS